LNKTFQFFDLIVIHAAVRFFAIFISVKFTLNKI
jgi:hypothetical protein